MTNIEHTTSKGNKIYLTAAWSFDETGTWRLNIYGTVDGHQAEYRGRTAEIDGKKFALVHVRADAAYGVPLDKWTMPQCPESEEWKGLLEAFAAWRKASAQEEAKLNLRAAIDRLWNSSTEEGRVFRNEFGRAHAPTHKRDIVNLDVGGPLAACITLKMNEHANWPEKAGPRPIVV